MMQSRGFGQSRGLDHGRDWPKKAPKPRKERKVSPAFQQTDEAAQRGQVGGRVPGGQHGAHVAQENVRTPADLALYFANAVSRAGQEYRHQPFMVEWFAERLGQTRWCGDAPQVPVLLTTKVFCLAIDHWARENRHLVGRQIWSGWSQWADVADLLDEGVVAFSSGPTRMDHILAEEAAKLGVEGLDVESKHFRRDLEAALDDMGTDTGALVGDRRARQAWLGRARQLHQIEVEDAEEEGREPRSLEEILAEVQEGRRATLERRRRERLKLQRKVPEEGLEPEDEDDVPARPTITADEAADMKSRLDAARAH